MKLVSLRDVAPPGCEAMSAEVLDEYLTTTAPRLVEGSIPVTCGLCGAVSVAPIRCEVHVVYRRGDRGVAAILTRDQGGGLRCPSCGVPSRFCWRDLLPLLEEREQP
jgi:hypothetical protein